jgi:hypothetical protein
MSRKDLKLRTKASIIDKVFPPNATPPGKGEVQGVRGAGGVGARQVPTKLATTVPEQRPPTPEIGSEEYERPLSQHPPWRVSGSYE